MTNITPNPVSPSDAQPSADADALLKLHKMSRTAGLGNNEYMAVNALSVATVVFGVASGLVIFDAVFLLMPMVAIALGVWALVQIHNSNGTQTGRVVAWLGIVLAIGFTGFFGSKKIAEIYGTREDSKSLSEVIAAFGADISARNYDAAYARCSERFMASNSKEKLTGQYEAMQNNSNYGKILSMQWNQRANFSTEPRTNAPTANSIALVKLQNGGTDRHEFRFVKRSGKWLIDDIPTVFPPPEPAPGRDAPR